MAAGGVEQCLTSFQQATLEKCEVCLKEDSVKHGQWFCQQCRQRMCNKCLKYHRNISTTRSHELIRADEILAPTTRTQEGVSDEVSIPMCQTHNEPFESYCQDHKTPACGTCKLLTHRKCQLQDLEHAAADSTGRNLDALQQLRETAADMKKIGEVLDGEGARLESQKNNTVKTIKRKMNKIEVLGQKKISEVEKNFVQEREGLDRESSVIKKSTTLVEKSIKDLERASNVGSEEEIFLATKQAEDDLTKFQDILKESSLVPHLDMYFEVDDSLTNITSIGKVCVKKSTIRVNLTPEITEILNTKQSDSWIMWFDVLPSEQIILLAYDPTHQTSQLSLHGANKKLLSKLDLPAAVSADMLDNHQLIVPVPETQQLQIVNMDNDNLTKGPSIKTKILDLTGKVEKHIKPRANLQIPELMRMSHAKKTVYIVDHDKGCLGFNLRGDKIFHYTSTDCHIYSGLAVDPDDALYFSAMRTTQGSKDMIKLSPEGQVLQEIDIRWIYPLRCIRNKLYVTGYNDQNEVILSYFYVQ